MKTIYLYLLSLFFVLNAQGQNAQFQWVNTVGSIQDDKGYSICTDTADNVYITGTFRDSIDFDPGTGIINFSPTNNNDVFISKFDSDGNYIWTKTFGGIGIDEGRSIDLDSAGNIYVTGKFINTVDFDPGAGVFNITSNGGSDIFILKLNNNGDFIWAKSFGGPSFEEVRTIKIDNSGNLLFTGYFSGSVDFDPNIGIYNISASGVDCFILKLDENGNFIWAKSNVSVGSAESNQGTSLTVDALDNVYITGFYGGTVDFDPSPFVFNMNAVSPFYDGFVQKLDANGNLLWVKSVTGSGYVKAYSISTDGFGNVYTSGSLKGSGDFDPGPSVFNLSSNGGHDVFILKLDSNGSFIWAKSMGGTSLEDGFSHTTDFIGNVFTTGRYTYTVDFDPNAGVHNLSTLGAASECFIQALNPNGDFLWAKSIGGRSTIIHPFNPEAVGLSITLGSLGNLYVSGFYNDWLTYNIGGTSTTDTANYSEDVFFLKMDPIYVAVVHATICPGDNYTFPDGTTGSAQQTQTSTFTNAAGYDSIIVTNLSVTTLDVSVTQTLQTLTANASGANYQWLDCNNGNATISGATNASYTPTAITGAYAVEVTENGCIDTSICYLVDQSGIDELSANNIIVHPNPTTDYVTVEWEGSIISIELTDVRGRMLSRNVVSNVNETHFNVSTYSSGVYLIRVIGDNASAIFNVIKK